ncbi:hypothetical protein [Methylotenera sp.]|uniref:hypothetical protein n=1 Tax=Methylotenera sp. TaxID=2051956 RepID=UPI002732E9DD|nr:hypothetical protein [Methylotenera sp.]MDP3211453.1 hypothetical protein [Methylotenera sp.]
MNLQKLSLREQVLSALVVTVLIIGGYSFLRFVPAYKATVEMQAAILKSQAHLQNTEIPEMPDEDFDELEDKLNDLTQSVNLLKANSATIESRFAPEDSQELRLRISELARQHGVRIRGSNAFEATSSISAAAGAVVSQADAKRAARKAQREAERAAMLARAGKGPAKVAVKKEEATQAQIVIPSEDLGWLARLAPGSIFHRPLQTMSVEGDFEGIRSFIRGLDQLPWQVTVVKLDIAVIAADMPLGVPQPLSAQLVLAL